MAEREMATILDEAEQRNGGAFVVAEHRIGLLEVGEASIAIAAAHEHRGRALDALRYAIDEIKKRVPIWKRELYADGSESWVDPTRSGGDDERIRRGTSTAGRSSTCGSPSPTSATSAVSTACPRKACSGSLARRYSTTKRSRRSSPAARAAGSEAAANHRRRADDSTATRDSDRGPSRDRGNRRSLALHQRSSAAGAGGKIYARPASIAST